MFTAKFDILNEKELVLIVWEHFDDKPKEVQEIYSGEKDLIVEAVYERFGIIVNTTIH